MGYGGRSWYGGIAGARLMARRALLDDIIGRNVSFLAPAVAVVGTSPYYIVRRNAWKKTCGVAFSALFS